MCGCAVRGSPRRLSTPSVPLNREFRRMSQQTESHAGAVALDVSSAVPVQLRLSAADRLWAVLRWLFWLVGLVVVLWLGAAFLSAAPASAAVPATVAPSGLLKGGNSKSAGGKNGDASTTDDKK